MKTYVVPVAFIANGKLVVHVQVVIVPKEEDIKNKIYELYSYLPTDQLQSLQIMIYDEVKIKYM